MSALRGSIHWPRSLSASTSRRNRSASALRRTSATGSCRAGRGSGARYLPVALLDVGHRSPPLTRVERARSGHAKWRISGGHREVNGGHWRSQRKEPLTWHNTTSEVGGDDGNRTHVQGFAGPCLNHSATSPCQVTMPRPGQERTTIQRSTDERHRVAGLYSAGDRRNDRRG